MAKWAPQNRQWSRSGALGDTVWSCPSDCLAGNSIPIGVTVRLSWSFVLTQECFYLFDCVFLVLLFTEEALFSGLGPLWTLVRQSDRWQGRQQSLLASYQGWRDPTRSSLRHGWTLAWCRYRYSWHTQRSFVEHFPPFYQDHNLILNHQLYYFIKESLLTEHTILGELLNTQIRMLGYILLP